MRKTSFAANHYFRRRYIRLIVYPSAKCPMNNQLIREFGKYANCESQCSACLVLQDYCTEFL